MIGTASMVNLEDFREMEDANRKPAAHWTELETNALLALWKENIVNLRRAKRNKHVYAKIEAELFARHKILHTITEIKNKIENLAKTYRKEKLKVTSDGSPSQWRYFDQVNAIFGSLSCHGDALLIKRTPIFIQDGAVVGTEIMENGDPITFQKAASTPEDFSESEASAPSDVRRKPKRRKMNHSQELGAIVQSLCERQVTRDEEVREHNKATLEILQKQTELEEKSVAINDKILDLFTKFLNK